jgi:hypothetical protein
MAEAAVRINHLEEVVTKLKHDELITQVTLTILTAKQQLESEMRPFCAAIGGVAWPTCVQLALSLYLNTSLFMMFSICCASHPTDLLPHGGAG